MTMSHKAFVFDHAAFASELEPILLRALETGDANPVRDFILRNRAAICDPDEGELLDDSWEQSLERRDVHEYGDFALAKFYDPSDDIGLADQWEDVQSLVAAGPVLGWSPILGSVIGSEDDPFDPGKMGSYIQSPAQVVRSIEVLRRIAEGTSSGALDAAIAMLATAVSNKQGLYVTF